MATPRLLCILLAFLLPSWLLGNSPIVGPSEDARRLEVLFLGAPTENGKHHDPITRYRVLKKALGTSGINLTYTQDLAQAFDKAYLDQFDALLFYANWPELSPEREKVLMDYIASGKGFLPIHCASACFGNSKGFIELVGGRFKSHGGEVFAPVTVDSAHPIMQGLGELEAWDETYKHDNHNEQRHVLQVRKDPAGDEPWTWVRDHGKGRIFYTASGHDHRVWDHPQFHALLRNAILWAVGDAAHAKLKALALPELKEQDVEMPGYKQRKAITKAQMPLSPAESAKMIQVPLGFEFSLFAAEPDIVNPIYVAWDHRGRAFVIETIDYPNNLHDGNIGNDRIKICEDTDGDGRADKFTVFADKLSIPTSLVFANGGVIATNGTELLFLQDTDGDDVADVRKPLITGFSMRDTHAGPSNLRYGFDNWIYATIGYSGFEGTVGGKPAKFTQGLFRFKADGSAIEYLQPTTNNTWGLGFMEDGSILGSTANGNPSWYFTFPAERYDALGLNQPRTPRADDNPFYYPSSMDIRQVDVHDKYTSGAGHSFYNARRFPSDYQGKAAFVTEPTGKLIGTFDVRAEGSAYVARQRPNNIFNSADAWTSPVAAEVGPDGALWVADWYNLIIQHNPTPTVGSAGVDAKNGRGNAYETALRDKEYGRLWRVYPKGSEAEKVPALNIQNVDTLVSALSHPNMLWRMHAQRLIVESKNRRASAGLRKLVNQDSAAAVHAFHALAGIGMLDQATIKTGLTAPQFGVRRAAYDAASRQFPDLLKAHFLSAKVPTEGREGLELLVAVSRIRSTPEVGRKVFAVGKDLESRILKEPGLADAWQVAARSQALGVLEAAFDSDLTAEKQEQTLAGQVLQLVAYVGASENRGAILASAKQRQTAFSQYVQAILAVEPVAAKGEVKFAPNAEVHKRGSQVYTNVCAACHGVDGKGVPGAFPPLAGSEWVTGPVDVPIRIALHGLMGPIKVKGVEYNGAMPPVPAMSNGQLADVLTYIRQNFGNDAQGVSEGEVATVRRENRERQAMWTAEELKK